VVEQGRLAGTKKSSENSRRYRLHATFRLLSHTLPLRSGEVRVDRERGYVVIARIVSSLVVSSLLVMQSICQLNFVQIPWLMLIDAANLPQITHDAHKASATDLPCSVVRDWRPSTKRGIACRRFAQTEKSRSGNQHAALTEPPRFHFRDDSAIGSSHAPPHHCLRP
jgi:hypothetical protein